MKNQKNKEGELRRFQLIKENFDEGVAAFFEKVRDAVLKSTGSADSIQFWLVQSSHKATELQSEKKEKGGAVMCIMDESRILASLVGATDW